MAPEATGEILPTLPNPGNKILTLEEKLDGQKQVKTLESQRNARHRALFDAQDEIDSHRGQLIAEIEGELQQRVSQKMLFSIRWSLT